MTATPVAGTARLPAASCPGREDRGRDEPSSPCVSLRRAQRRVGAPAFSASLGPPALEALRRRTPLLLALLVLAVAGCAGHHATVADCLNGRGFLVRGKRDVLRGSSPRGVNFTLTVYPGPAAAKDAFAAGSAATSVLLRDAVVDFTGNPPATPGGVPGRLSKSALATIRRCLARP